MSNADEMGLTPAAAMGYEQFFVPAIFYQWPEKLIAAAGIEAGHDVLDVGCGTGVLTRELSRVVGEQGAVHGLDFSESMLGVARKECPGVEFRQGDATVLPYPNESFDRVTSSFMLMFVPEPAQAIREMLRVLRPGGRLAVSVWRDLGNNSVYGELTDATRRVIDSEAAELMAWPFTLGSTGQLEAIFSAAGAVNHGVAHYDGIARFPSVEAFVSTEVQAWLMADSVTENQLGALTRQLQARFESLTDKNGAFTFPLNATIGTAVTNIEHKSA